MSLVNSSPVGLPGLAVMATGFALFLLSLLVARSRSASDAGKQKKSSRSLAGIAVQGIAIGYAGFGPIDVALDPLSPFALGQAILIAILMAMVIGLFLTSARALGRNWSLVARTRSDHSLVIDGPFAHVRHPIYIALFLLMIALAVAFGHPLHLLIGVPLYALGTWLRIAEEERLLREMFGQDYDRYAARVRRFVPGVF
ncbi:isoprenylcysteine carboxylmethyltransferase family protein [Sphingomonas sp. So64.6b]|uniref:methyltransferase family protein n=1 Tax=Sphingomonas sp. So64.6b TaxID=2997354 RepID=UPI00160440DB|nr:isoprenylcysteine carboxylmethyltransferase family protein [Sphingomonas sp. So64.6b]QNA84124.1 isoprenylcysteine carboxylmethyltransferase family protein [Sphingomonas sp. So64.6b]